MNSLFNSYEYSIEDTFAICLDAGVQGVHYGKQR